MRDSLYDIGFELMRQHVLYLALAVKITQMQQNQKVQFYVA